MSNNEIVDISDIVADEDAVPLCPLCDNGMTEEEPVALVILHSHNALVHTICLMSAREEYDI